MQKLDPVQNYYIATSVSHNMDRIHMYYISLKYNFLKVWFKIYNFYGHVPFFHTGASGLAHWGQFPVLEHHWVTLVSTSLYPPLLSKCYVTPTTAMAIQSHTRQHSLLQKLGATRSMNSKNKDFWISDLQRPLLPVLDKLLEKPKISKYGQEKY